MLFSLKGDILTMLLNIVILIPILAFSITLHEVSHGYMAYWLGDRTAKYQGRLTFNPIKHWDLYGFLSMLLIGFGWAKPVPVNYNNFKKRKLGMVLTALAGPLSNIIFGVICIFFIVIGIMYLPAAPFLTDIFITAAAVNFMLAFFNLIPLPPLDGSKIFLAVLPDRHYFRLMQYERFGSIFIIVLILISNINPALDVFAALQTLVLNFTTMILKTFFFFT